MFWLVGVRRVAERWFIWLFVATMFFVRLPISQYQKSSQSSVYSTDVTACLTRVQWLKKLIILSTSSSQIHKLMLIPLNNKTKFTR